MRNNRSIHRNRRATRPAAATEVDRGRRAALWGAAALIAAMLADLAETVFDPASSGEATDVYEAAVHDHGRMVLCGYLLLASAVDGLVTVIERELGAVPSAAR